MMDHNEATRIIKKYHNRRLYDTEKSHYIKLSDLYEMIKNGDRFRVIEVDTHKDITHTILLQILTELETKQSEVLTVDLLRTLLSFYRDPTHAQLGRYLEHCLALYDEYQIRLKSPVNSILPTQQQANSLHDAAEDAHERWQADQPDVETVD